MKIYYDSDTGELGEIVETKVFKNEDSLTRADVLQDLLGSLDHLYKTDANKFFGGLEKIASNENQMKKDFPELFNNKGESNA